MEKKLLFFIALVITLSACDGPGFTEKSQGVIVDAPDGFWQDSILKEKLKIRSDTIFNYVLVRSDSIVFIAPLTDTIYPNATIVQVFTSYQTKDLQLPKWRALIGCKYFKYKDIQIRKEKHNDRLFILGWLQMTISICVIFIILSIWINFHIQQMPQIILEDLLKKLKEDKGILFISLALFFWASIGMIRIYSSNDCSENKLLHDALIRIFSLANNMFFLLSLPYFKHGVDHFKKYKAYYGAFAGILFLFSFLIILAISIDAPGYINTMKLFDVSYSAIVLTLLGYILYKSFSNRGFKAISKLTAVITIGVVFAQVVPFFPEIKLALGNSGHIMYHTTFIVTTILLVALMFSWYNEEREQMIQDGFLMLQEVVLEKDKTKLPSGEKHRILKEALAKGYVEQVLNALLSMPEKDPEDEQALILTSANYHTSKRENMLGKITYAELSLSLSKLQALLDDLINKWFPKNNGRAT